MSSAATSERQPVNSASLDLLVNAYYEYLLGAGAGASAPLPLAAREDIFERVESVGYRIGRESSCVRAGALQPQCDVTAGSAAAVATPSSPPLAAPPAGRYAERLARDRERLSDALDVMKFICREFWTDVFRKVGRAGAGVDARKRARAARPAPMCAPLLARSPWTSCRRTTRARFCCKT
jgi:hypothetical protein